MSDNHAVVFVVDDDASMRAAMESLIRSVGLSVMLFGSAGEFLEFKRTETPACLVLDVRMPGLSGLDLQRELTHSGNAIPIIFITGHGDIPMTVQAMKAGAMEFLTKPFHDQQLLGAIHLALAQDRKARYDRAAAAELSEMYEKLTAREREVMALVVAGLLNKQIAGRLGTTEITVKVHRGRVMEKMKAGSLAELVNSAMRLGIATAQHQ
jgi:FixJ family two-component response regulator